MIKFNSKFNIENKKIEGSNANIQKPSRGSGLFKNHNKKLNITK